MNRSIQQLAVVVALFFGLMTPPAWGGPKGGPPGGAMLNPRVLDEVAEQLQLDKATHDKLKDIAYRAQKDMVQLEANTKLGRMELHRLLEQDNPNLKTVLTQVDALGKLETDLRKQQISAMLEMRSQLTPEQREKLNALHAERMERRKQERGKRGKREGQGFGGPPDGAPMGGPEGDSDDF